MGQIHSRPQKPKVHEPFFVDTQGDPGLAFNGKKAIISDPASSTPSDSSDELVFHGRGSAVVVREEPTHSTSKQLLPAKSSKNQTKHAPLFTDRWIERVDRLRRQTRETSDMLLARAIGARESFGQKARRLRRKPVGADWPTAECVICADEKPLYSFPENPPTTSCDHPNNICSDCVDYWILSNVFNNTWLSIRCPGCPSIFSHNDIKRGATAATFLRYDTLSTRTALGTIPDFTWCQSPDCSSGQENIKSATENAYMKCAACNYKQCTEHNVPWHEGESCAQYDARLPARRAAQAKQERESTRYLAKETTLCPGPKCGAFIQKTYGCDDMKCVKCGTHFCYVCGRGAAPLNSTSRIMNWFGGGVEHAATCHYGRQRSE